MTKLVIVESPAKCKKIEQILGNGYKCIASYGHFRMMDGLKSIDVNNGFKITYLKDKKKSKQISVMQSEIKKAQEVILATDNDREGEAIAWHICDTFNLNIKNTKRILFQEITKNAILLAVSNPTVININLVYAQQCRQVLDMLIGFKISPLLWKAITYNSSNSLSAGRCQTPALRIIYDHFVSNKDNELEIGYNINGLFTSHNIMFNLKCDCLINNSDTVNDFLETTVNHNHIIKKSPLKDIIKSSKAPFTTSTIQQEANNVYGYGVKQTMMLCQKLYESGFITYMRTDSITLNVDFVDIAGNYIEEKYGEDYLETPCKYIARNNNSDKRTQEAHEAIRPTDINITMNDLSTTFSAQERKMYKLIWKRTLESLMTDAKGKLLTSQITSPDICDKKVYYENKSESYYFLGWKILDYNNDSEKEYNILNKIKNNSEVKYNKITANVQCKSKVNHYTEARLVNTLEKKNIGRPSTYASIVDKIITRTYVENKDIDGKKHTCENYELENDTIYLNTEEKVLGNEKNKMAISSLGKNVIEFLIEKFDELFSYDYTVKMENMLDEITYGKENYETICDNFYKKLDIEIKDYNKKNPQKKHYIIDDIHTLIIGKNGLVICKKEGDNTEWISVKENITLNECIEKQLTLDDLVDNNLQTKIDGRNLGKYKEYDVILKQGKYGSYVSYNNINYSLKELELDFDMIELLDVKSYLEVTKDKLRMIDETLHIRNGKHGAYIFKKTKTMKKPQFISLSAFDGDYLTCDKSKIYEYIENEKNKPKKNYRKKKL